MRLTAEQLRQFDEEGYLFFPDYFPAEETAILKGEVPGIMAQRREENVRERTGDVVRTAFAVHTYNRVFEALIHHPRFVEPAEQMLRDRTYIHQFKLNGKAAFDGDVWQWHQDYGTWKADDDMPEARAMNLAVFLDEVNEFNGPLWFIPRSHKKGAIEASTTTTDVLSAVGDRQRHHRQAGEAGRHRRAQGRTGLGDLLPWHAGARQPAQHVAVGPPDRLRHLQRGLQRQPPLQAPGLPRPSRLHADRRLERGLRLPGRHPTRGRVGVCFLLPAKAGRRKDGTFKKGRTMNLHSMLQRRAAEGRRLRIGVIGAGKFGSMYLSQIPTTPGVHLVGIADISPLRAKENLARLGWKPEVTGAVSLAEARRHGNTHLGDDWRALVSHPEIDIIVEATGDPIAAVEHALEAFRNGKHVVMVTVEADAFCGPLLAKRAAEAGVVYSLAYGDQPALICELVDWARASGFSVTAAGRGHKWLPHYAQSTPETVWQHWG